MYIFFALQNYLFFLTYARTRALLRKIGEKSENICIYAKKVVPLQPIL